MASNGRSASPPSRTRSSRQRWWRSSRRSTRRSSWGSATGSGLGVEHDALDALAYGIKARKINWILDADISRFFDSLSPDWLVRFGAARLAAIPAGESPANRGVQLLP